MCVSSLFLLGQTALEYGVSLALQYVVHNLIYIKLTLLCELEFDQISNQVLIEVHACIR